MAKVLGTHISVILSVVYRIKNTVTVLGVQAGYRWFYSRKVMLQIDEFVRHFFMVRGEAKEGGVRGNVWHHFLTAYPHRADDNCLFLFYEDLVEVCMRTCLLYTSDAADE